MKIHKINTGGHSCICSLLTCKFGVCLLQMSDNLSSATTGEGIKDSIAARDTSTKVTNQQHQSYSFIL